ncbi:hypothetical protein Poli38472_005152 [Pythium oligandrum]|uniref:EF-hand domain-containing protein n=1 Tax=Pythium oligandrum TaxID=41045 RepID=A0A8K1FIX7_PYTOL|nr:hypothetical protein Poli38472_005152 [Pythium oligandrum]|eukprot:TMW62534.1 hypothetical protein Poli38472_005152 [Pythium oligandrum]
MSLTSVVMSLDREAMENMHRTFNEMQSLQEDEFVAEMLVGLTTQDTAEDERIELTAHLSALFQQIDVRAEGMLNWEDFSTFVSQTSDMVSAVEDNVINKYQADTSPSPMNLVNEIEGMRCLSEIDQIVLYGSKIQGLQLYDLKRGHIKKPPAKMMRGEVTDAVYCPMGDYIVTASSSRVLSFYDSERLHICQQLPTECVQTALALNAPLLYSGGVDGQVTAWDLERHERRHSFFDAKQSVAAISDVEVIHRSDHLACATLDGTIHIVDLSTGKALRSLKGRSTAISLLRYCSDVGYLVSAGTDHTLQVWNPHLEQKIVTLPGHRHQLIGMEVRANTPEVITADQSGIIKIWDLRKFDVVQTIVRELYARDHGTTSSSRSRSRQMTAMCYLAPFERIAIAHSSIFFLDRHEIGDSSGSKSRAIAERRSRTYPDEIDEASKPISVVYNPPQQSFIAIMPSHVVCWDAATGQLTRKASILLNSEVTCVCLANDHHSCFVGCDDGTVARLMMPNGSVIKKVNAHRADVTVVRYLPTQRTVVSGGGDGSIVVSQCDSFEQLYVLNHWRGVRSVRYDFRDDDPVSTDEDIAADYSVPLHLREFFGGTEIERLKYAFGDVDRRRTGKIPVNELPGVLEKAFPSRPCAPVNQHEEDRSRAAHEADYITFAMFMEVLKDAFSGKGKSRSQNQALALANISSLDINEELGVVITASSTDGTFCVWNLKNGAVAGQGTARDCDSDADLSGHPISHVLSLSPLPFFVCVEESSKYISIWSCKPMPPILSHSHMCLLRFPHTSVATHTRGKPDVRRGSNAFLTELKPISSERTDTSSSSGKKECMVRALDWLNTEGNDRRLLCIGDEQGGIGIYDFKAVLSRIEEMKRPRTLQKHQSNLGRSSYSEQPAQEEPASQDMRQYHRDMFPPTLMQKLYQWVAHEGVAVRQVRVAEVENLVQPNRNKRVIVISLAETGPVSLWSIDGQLLGRLNDSFLTEPAIPWKLNVDAEGIKLKSQESAATMLRQVEQRLSVAYNLRGESEASDNRRESSIVGPFWTADHEVRTRRYEWVRLLCVYLRQMS